MTGFEAQKKLYWLKNTFDFDVYYQVKIYRNSWALENRVNYHTELDGGKNHFTGFTSYVVVDWEDDTKFRIYTFYTKDKDKTAEPLWHKDLCEAKDVRFWLKQFYSSCRYIKLGMDKLVDTKTIMESDVYKEQYERLKKIAESGECRYYDGTTDETRGKEIEEEVPVQKVEPIQQQVFEHYMDF